MVGMWGKYTGTAFCSPGVLFKAMIMDRHQFSHSQWKSVEKNYCQLLWDLYSCQKTGDFYFQFTEAFTNKTLTFFKVVFCILILLFFLLKNACVLHKIQAFCTHKKHFPTNVTKNSPRIWIRNKKLLSCSGRGKLLKRFLITCEKKISTVYTRILANPSISRGTVFASKKQNPTWENLLARL